MPPCIVSYLNLETYCKAGVAVATPVWFAAAGGTLCVHSLADAGKVKRIRSRAQVRIAPCDIRGKLKGEWVGASARIVHGEEAALGHRLLDQKYGWMKPFGALLNRLRRRQYAVIAIQVQPTAAVPE